MFEILISWFTYFYIQLFKFIFLIFFINNLFLPNFFFKTVNLRGCLALFFWSLNFHHSSLITQFFIPIWHHYPISITQYFSHYLWAHTYQPVQPFFFFFLVPKLTEAKKKKKPELKTELVGKKKKPELKTEPVKKKKIRTEDRTSGKKKPNSQPRKKKVKVVKSFGWYCLRVPHVCLITKMPLSYKLWKLKTVKMCFQFP